MRNFQNVIDKAKESCKNSKFNLDEQLVEVNKLSKRNNNAVANIQGFSENLNMIRNSILGDNKKLVKKRRKGDIV